MSHNLIELFEVMTKKIDESTVVGIVYMDFTKIFDKFRIGRLLQKVR